MNNPTLGGSSARADIERGSVMTESEAWAHAHKLWPVGEGRIRWPGQRQEEEGHSAMIYGDGFYRWSDLRAEWVRDYMEALKEATR